MKAVYLPSSKAINILYSHIMYMVITALYKSLTFCNFSFYWNFFFTLIWDGFAVVDYGTSGTDCLQLHNDWGWFCFYFIFCSYLPPELVCRLVAVNWKQHSHKLDCTGIDRQGSLCVHVGGTVLCWMECQNGPDTIAKSLGWKRSDLCKYWMR